MLGNRVPGVVDWDDLRIFIACARAGSFKDGAGRLNLDATTIARRIQRLEDRLRTTLFVRSPRGLQVTAAGAELLEASHAVEAAVDAIGRHGPFSAATGTVRLRAPECFSAFIVAPAVPALLDGRPGLYLELATRALSPSSREVDLAVTHVKPSSSRLAVEELTRYSLGLHAATAYLSRYGRPASVRDLGAHQLIGHADDLEGATESPYPEELRPSRVRASSASILGQLQLTRAGAGICLLPHFVVGNSAGLEPVLNEEVQTTRTLWLAIHNELRTCLRVRAVREWLLQTVTARADQLRPPRRVEPGREAERIQAP